MSSLQHATNMATFDADFATLGANLAALQDFARSLPAGVTVPIVKRAMFDELSGKVETLFDRLSYALAAVESDALY